MEKKWLLPLAVVPLLIACCYFYLGEKPKEKTITKIGEEEEGKNEVHLICFSPSVVSDMIYPNETKKYQFTLYNKGNVKENVSICISELPYKWEVVAHPNKETIPPGGRTSFTISVNASWALPETSAEITLNARTEKDSKASAEMKLHVQSLVDQRFNQTREVFPARLSINQNLSVAQEFIPSLLHLWKVGVNVTCEDAEKMLWICIRKELNGTNLSRKCISPTETTGWLEAHLPATLERNEKYYLVFESDARNGSYYANAYWHFTKINDPYLEGGVWVNSGGTWKDVSNYMDMEFCTWGYK